ncbi:hypothetical protein VDGD_00142 [Verticillium dahliae]|nr:hypothetical protein VDGD_00142 [Verticillium dahliae]
MALQDYKLTHFLVSSPAPFVAHVEINRPKKLNAFSEEVWLEFGRLFDRLSHDPEVRAVVLSGAGDRAFTAGLDVQSAGEGLTVSATKGVDAARNAAVLRRHIAEFQACITAMEKCEKRASWSSPACTQLPNAADLIVSLLAVICVLHGIALGLAIDIACCADVRLAARGTRFAVKEVDIGLAADIGSLARLPRIVGSMSWVKDVCLSARDFSADEALAVGFVSRVLETKAAAVEAGLEMAARLATKSPVAVQGTKELLNHAKDNTIANSLRYTGVWNAAALQSGDFTAALQSGLTKKQPRFEKL